MRVCRSELADGIRKHGFRKWYERELISSHAHLVLTVLATLGLLGSFEVFDRGASVGDQLVTVASVLACSAIGLWALRRYLYLLAHAEAVANQAVCPQCATYARLELTAEQPAADAVRVRCRHCEHRWSLTD